MLYVAWLGKRVRTKKAEPGGMVVENEAELEKKSEANLFRLYQEYLFTSH